MFITEKIPLVVFLERLSTKYDPLPSSHVIHLGTIYKLATIQNAEIRTVFYEIAFADPTTEAARTYANEAATWVTGAGTGMPIGRLKFCRPVFRGMFKVDKKIALDTYAESKQFFHPIARKLMEKVRLISSDFTYNVKELPGSSTGIVVFLHTPKYVCTFISHKLV
jgi:leukotriene-A4 hydrolase